MAKDAVPLTHMRREEALAFLDQLANGLAQTLGPSCEALVQELSGDGVCTVRSIYNGQVSGRQVGSTLSIYGEDTATGDQGAIDLLRLPVLCSEARTADGRRVKSSTWALRGRGYVLLLGVNLDVTALDAACDVLAGLASVGEDLRTHLGGETAPAGADALIEECLHELGKPAETLARQERLELVRRLVDRGLLDYQKSVVTLAARLGVSKNTIYLDLRDIKRRRGPAEG